MNPVLTVVLMLIGIAVAAVSFRARPPHRLSLLLVGMAFIVGPITPLLGNQALQRTFSIATIVLASIAIVNSGVALIRRSFRDLRG